MKCTAKSIDGSGIKYRCANEATVKLTTVTFAAHLQRNVTKVRCLCAAHAKRKRHDYNYKIKHCGKKATIIEEPIQNKEQ